MKRTNFVTKLISVILFVFMSIYLGVYLIQSWRNPMTTAPAIILPAEESFSSAGILVREETLVTAPYSIVSSYVADGEKVSAGQAYLVAYSSEQDRERAVKAEQLQQEIGQLEANLSAGSTLDQAAAAETEIKRQIMEMNYAVSDGDLSDLESRAIALRSSVFSGDAAATTARLDSLREELAALGQVSGGTTMINAPQSGVYSSKIDGFEDVTLAMVSAMSAGELSSLITTERTVADVGAGKLVTGVRWYYATVVDESQADYLRERLDGNEPNAVTVQFSGMDAQTVVMRVHALEKDEDGGTVAIFSATTSLSETLPLRQTEAKVVYNSYEGLRVPREAMYWDEENNAYLFTLTGNVAEKKYVRIVYETDEYYLVEPDLEHTTSASSFREGNTIIVSAKNLYDGKVVS